MKFKVIIKGKVHGVGYRIMLINLALEYGIDRFSTFNTKIDGKEAVICLIDAPEWITEEIKNQIQSKKPERALIESIEFEEFQYEIPPIERSMQAFQMEHWGKAIPILLDIRDSVREESQKTRDELGTIIKEESQKTRDELGTIIKEESQKTRTELGNKIDSAKTEIGGKIDLLRSDLKEYIEINFKKLSDEMGEVKRDLEKLKEALRKAGISV